MNCIAGTVRAAVADRDGWKLCIDPTSSDMDLTSTDSDSISIHADHVIFVCGARPCIGRDYESSSVSQANPLPPLHSMDSLVDPRRCQTLVREVGKAVVWGVVGGSHSAMLIVKNLLEAGVDRVVNYYKSDLRIMHQTPDGWLRYSIFHLNSTLCT